MGPDLLLIEELLASQSLWLQSPDSLRGEAVSMVAAITQDLAAISGLRPAVLLCPAASASPALRTLLPAGLGRCLTDREPAEWMRQPDVPTESIRHLLIVAPEFDGRLVERLREAESGPLREAVRLNLSASLAETFSDKFATAAWLEQRGLPTPPTLLVTDEQRGELTSGPIASFGRHECTGVLKPRFGAGCDQVQLISKLPLSATLASGSDNAEWVVQPRVRGRACSISLIGRGESGPALILPPGDQRITADAQNNLHYRGGRIPCGGDSAAAVTAVAEAFRSALGPFRGWLGLDVVVSSSGLKEPCATIIEVNPRLCTSYVGYRKLTSVNLAEQMLYPRTEPAVICWKRQAVRFSPAPCSTRPAQRESGASAERTNPGVADQGW
jgi:predicted ATP-grasp superfamily ATP-dependent carboligase